MRFYTFSLTDTELIITKNPKRVYIERVYIFLQVFILSSCVPFILYVSSSGNNQLNWRTAIAIGIIAALFFLLYFRKFLKEKNIALTKMKGEVIFNGINIGKLNEIRLLEIKEYVSAEAITGIKTIILWIGNKKIPIAEGVNEKDYPKIKELFTSFLVIPQTNVVEKIY